MECRHADKRSESYLRYTFREENADAGQKCMEGNMNDAVEVKAEDQ